MDRNAERPSQGDLDAYVDGDLDAATRIAVEAFLAGNPEIAGQVMADMRVRDELRLVLSQTPAASPRLRDAAARLERGLWRRRALPMAARVAILVAAVAAGWIANEMLGAATVTQVAASTPPPAYVDDAIRAHRTTGLRLDMGSQIEAPAYNSGEVRAATGIVMPRFPSGWRVLDVQVYPSEFGPSVTVAAVTPDLGQVSVFAVRPGSPGLARPMTTTSEGFGTASFQVDDVAYTLVASASAVAVEAEAVRLAAGVP